MFLAAAGTFLLGVGAERARARFARRRWQARRGAGRGATIMPFAPRRPGARTGDAADQLRTVMRSRFATRRLLSKAEVRVLYQAEDAIRAQGLSWLVLAQVSLSEILASPDAAAYAAISAKRADLLLVTRAGEPVAVIEQQGEGHHQGGAAARDAVKKEALRRAGVAYIEVTPQHTPADLARDIARLAAAARSSPSAQRG